MAVTLQQVATLAGVSLATASRVLNRSSRHPREDITERVRAAAAQLGYVPNAQAQALARSSTALVGLVVHDIDDPYFATIAAGVQATSQAAGKQTLLACTYRDADLECAAIESFAAHRTEAIVLAGSRRSAPASANDRLVALCTAYQHNGGRVALVGQPLPGFSAVVPENRSGAMQLVRELLTVGHRRFVVVAGPRWLRTSTDRADAFEAEVRRHVKGNDACDGVQLLPRIVTDFTRDGAYDGVTDLLKSFGDGRGTDAGPLCILAVSDVMALGVLAACRDANVPVPSAVGVAGFDDIKTLRDTAPSLTTVHLDLQGMGAEAGRLALAARGDPPSLVPFPATVVLRDSTRLATRTS
ncbi:LacI family DNA-binding transcriptional regulator [Terrabacter sp. 2YAF2]|uniref:LacI family DNA-binding transcriptional regulator n=1 Tax=Terrabacter sp. 2YAF2 TaxID=3233026 RepID=UPI003F9913A9